MGDDRAEGLSVTEDGGQAAISLTPGIDGTHIRILESSQLEGSYVGSLLYRSFCLLPYSEPAHDFLSCLR